MQAVSEVRILPNTLNLVVFMNKIPIVDLFAGPGGLNEGFARYVSNQASPRSFSSVLSVEKDSRAHLTLQLRAMRREILDRSLDPAPYWHYVRLADYDSQSNRGLLRNETKLARIALQEHAAQGYLEAPRPLELGKDNEIIDHYLEERLDPQSPWVLLGGPPCQAYSGMGRSRMKNVDPEAFAKDHRHTLYQEYLRVVARWRPAVFVMENVKGVLSSEHGKDESTDGAIVDQIMEDLKRPTTALSRIDPAAAKHCGNDEYDLYSFVCPPGLVGNRAPEMTIHAEKFGIPQARHRVIILGVRRSHQSHSWNWRPIGANGFDVFGEVGSGQAINDLPSLRGGLTKTQSIPAWPGAARLPDWKRAVEGFLRPLLNADASNDALQDRKLATAIRKNLAELRKFQPEDATQYRSYWRTRLTDWQRNPSIQDWYRFQECYEHGPLLEPLNHYCKSHQSSDLARYFFVASASRLYEGKKFRLRDFPDSLLPNFGKLKKGKDSFTDCFTAVQPAKPSLTVMSHISKDGHYYIHPDPKQVRSLSVREAARLQTFPDDYFFEGPQTEQYHQVGNAVPPMLATQLADVVFEIISTLFQR